MFNLKHGETFDSDHLTPLLQPAENGIRNEQDVISPASTMPSTSSPLANLFFRPIKRGSLRSSIFALICVTLGTGMLPLPYFFKTNGIILTLIIYTFCGIATYLTLLVLINMAYLNDCYSYNDLVAKYFGKKMEIYAIIVLLINSFGSIIMWNVYIYQFTRDILAYFSPSWSNEITLLYISLAILLFIQIPLAAHSTGTEFDIMATLGFIQIVYVILVLFIEFPGYATQNFSFKIMGKMETYFNFNMKMVEMPFVFFIAFGNHSTILAVINEVKNKNLDRVNKVGRRTFFGEFFIYIAIIFMSFFSTYNKTNEIFLVRPQLSLLMMIGEILMVILMICNISLYYFTTMPTLELLLNDNNKFTSKQNIMAAFTVLTSLTFVSFYIDKTISILSFIGVAAQVSLIFIIPISIYMKWKENELTTCQKAQYIFYIVFFTLIGIGGFVIMLMNQFTEVI